MSAFERTFLGWARPALHEAARRMLDAAEGGGGRSPGPGDFEELDLGGHVAVVPGARAARRLRELLLEGQLERGLPLRPPRVVTVGGLPELLYDPEAPPPPPLRARLAWAEALAALPGSDAKLLLSRPPRPGDLQGWLALARLIEGLHRELGADGLSFREVAAVCGSGMLFDDEPRWSVLARVQEGALQVLRKEGWEDPEAARRRALEEGRIRLPGPVWLVALPELGRLAREMLAAAAASPGVEGRVRALVHAPEEEAAGFFPDGTLRPEGWLDRPLPLAEEDLFVEGGPADQAERAVRVIAALGGAFQAEEVTLGVADPEVVPYLVQRMERQGAPVRVAAGRPLASTGPHLLLTALARHLEEGTAEALAELARHPDLGGWLRGDGLDPAGVLRDLDEFRARALPLRIDGRPLPGRERVRGRAGSERLRRRVEALLEPFRAEAPLAEWVGETSRLLERLYGGRALDPAGARDRELAAFAEALRPVLDGAAGALPGGGPEVRGAAALRVWLGEVAEGAVPPQAERAAVEVLGTLEIHLDDAPVLVMTGVNDPFLPQAVVGHPFLPDRLRSALGITDNRRRLARDAYRLTAALHSRERAVLVAGRRSGVGDPLRPSPLLLRGDPEAAAERILTHYGEGARGAGPAADLSDADGPGLPLPPEPELPSPGLPLRIRVTAFRGLIENPYLWLLAEHIGTDGWVEDGARELDPRGFGSLAHRVVEALGRELRHEKDEARLAAELEARLRQEVRDGFGTRPMPAVRVQASQLAVRLRALAAAEAVERALGWETVAIEAGPGAEGVPFDAGGGEVFLTGKIDRVDRHPELGWRLLDYKTSEQATDPDRDHRRGRGDARRWVHLQLPLYRHLAPRVPKLAGDFPAVGAEGPVGLGYVSLPRALPEIGLSMAAWDADDLASADEAARAALRPLLTGDPIPFDPTARPPRAGVPLGALVGVGILSAGPDADDGESTDA